MKVAGAAPRPPIDPLEDLRPRRSERPRGPVGPEGEAEAPRSDTGLPRIDGAAPLRHPVEIDRGRLSVGTLRREIADLVVVLSHAPDPSREDRAALWALKGELRKLTALDQYVSGFLRG